MEFTGKTIRELEEIVDSKMSQYSKLNAASNVIEFPRQVEVSPLRIVEMEEEISFNSIAKALFGNPLGVKL